METARLAASEIVNRTLRTSGLRGLGGLSPVDAVTALAAQIYRGEQPSI